jgi:hypothetical protein
MVVVPPSRDDGGVEEHATALADAIEGALPAWVERAVARRAPDRPDLAPAAADAGRRAAAEVAPRLRSLLEADIDDQRTTPLAVVRAAAVTYPGAVLAAAGVPAVQRDEVQERLFPDDVYDLAPATFADVDPALGDVALAWGAAKAWEHRRRHGSAAR